MFSKETATHSKNDNRGFMVYNKVDKITIDLFESLLIRYHIGFEASVKGSGFIFECVLFIVLQIS